MRPSGRKLKENPPASPSATVSTVYSEVLAGWGARVCPDQAGIGAYPSGAALSPGGMPAACAGGRGTARSPWARSGRTLRIRDVVKPIRNVRNISFLIYVIWFQDEPFQSLRKPRLSSFGESRGRASHVTSSTEVDRSFRTTAGSRTTN